MRQTSDEYFKQLRLLYLYIVAISFIATGTFAYTFYQNPSNLGMDPQQEVIFLIIALVILPTSFLLGVRIFNSHVRRETSDINGISYNYRKGYIIRLAFVEGAVLLEGIFAYLTGNFYLLVAATLGLLYIITLRPSRDKFLDEIDAKGKIRSYYQKGDNIVTE